MADIDLIQNRRREIASELEQIDKRKRELIAEANDLDTAGRVLARLSGAEWRPFGAPDGNVETPPQTADPWAALDKKHPTMPEMILEVMQQSFRQGLKGLEPKEMADRIQETFKIERKGESVSAIAWRMWKRGQLEKDEDSPLYSLPKKNEAGGQLFEDNPTASESKPEHDREAGRGGGT